MPRNLGRKIYITGTEDDIQAGNYKVGQTCEDDAQTRIDQLTAEKRRTSPESKPFLLVHWYAVEDGVTDFMVRNILDVYQGVFKTENDNEFRGGLGQNPRGYIDPIITHLNNAHCDNPMQPGVPEYTAPPKILYEHQTDALKAVLKAYTEKIQAARIVLPTGGGKTLVEAHAIEQIFSKHNGKRFLVLAPRIALVNQLTNEIYRDVNIPGLKCHVFHSGNFSAASLSDEEMSERLENFKWANDPTTDINALNKQLQDGENHIIFSTYDSSCQLSEIEFDVLVCDESQYCTRTNFFEYTENIQAKSKFFFTATERFMESGSGEHKGLNNEKVFGERIHLTTPAELIGSKIICQPVLDVAYVENPTGEKDLRWIVEVAQKQNYLCRALPFRKILYVCEGVPQVNSFAANYKQITEGMPGSDIFVPGFDILTIEANSATINGEPADRNDWMKALNNDRNMLVFHYDILSEGIDVSGICSVVFMRKMNSNSKILQNAGRAMRPYRPNPELKPVARLVVPVIDGDEANYQQMVNIVSALYSGGYESFAETVKVKDPDEIIVSDRVAECPKCDWAQMGPTPFTCPKCGFQLRTKKPSDAPEDGWQDHFDYFLRFEAGKPWCKRGNFWESGWEEAKPRDNYKNSMAYLYPQLQSFPDHQEKTPIDMIIQLLDKYKSMTTMEGRKYLVLFNVEFVVALHTLYDIPLKDITLYSESDERTLFCGQHEIQVIQNTEEIDMTKFDTVLSNPPYQAKNHKANKLWINFVDKFSAVDHALFVTPESLFTSSSKKISKLRTKIVPRIAFVDSDSNNYFDIGEKICSYFLFNDDSTNFDYKDINKKTHTIKKHVGPYRFCENGELILSILKKIENSNHQRLKFISDFNPGHKFKFEEKLVSGEISETKSNKYKYPILHSLGRGGKYFYTKTAFPSSGKLKVAIPYSATYGTFQTEEAAMGQQVVGISVNSSQEGDIVKSNLNHPIFHFYIANEKTGGFNTGIFKLPDINFKKAWDSQALYKEFAFTKEEIKLIEENLQ